MPHAIFRKAKAVARLVRNMDYGASVICRSTEAGHVALFRARRTHGHVYIERGFQLVDGAHADAPASLSEFPTIVDDGSMSVAKLVKLCMVPNEALDYLAEQVPAPRIISPDEQREALEVARSGRQERRDKEVAHLRRLDAWLSRNCPHYGSLTRTEKEKVRQQACMELYGIKREAA